MPTQHTVRQGECLSSISDRYGFFWETLWNHADNARLKRERGEPNVLMPGDVVAIPDKRKGSVSAATGQRHRFRLKGVPAKLRIRLLIDDEPRANEPYTLMIDDTFAARGTTDGDGTVEQSIPPGARTGRLIVGEGDHEDVYELRLGALDPLDADAGVRGRLANLGYDIAAGLEGAIRAFQEAEGLDATGTMDAATGTRLKERFGL
ncbi:MAG: LysM peptidoglycan-binding domain-containing protein [Planctomycetes bacterium]|jgi:hypothetical protein|nr:LysM peptidoglycan-binding domain-containing protein [Planctomycetota bacterium]